MVWGVKFFEGLRFEFVKVWGFVVPSFARNNYVFGLNFFFKRKKILLKSEVWLEVQLEVQLELERQ